MECMRSNHGSRPKPYANVADPDSCAVGRVAVHGSRCDGCGWWVLSEVHGRGHQAFLAEHRAVRRLPPGLLRTETGETRLVLIAEMATDTFRFHASFSRMTPSQRNKATTTISPYRIPAPSSDSMSWPQPSWPRLYGTAPRMNGGGVATTKLPLQRLRNCSPRMHHRRLRGDVPRSLGAPLSGAFAMPGTT